MQPVAIAGDGDVPLQAAGPKAHKSGGSNMLREGVRNRFDNLTKTKGNLGSLQQVAVRMAMTQECVICELPRRTFQAMRATATFEGAGSTRGSER
jgi:hypothetical protein